MTHALATSTTRPAADQVLVDPETVPPERRALLPRYGDPTWFFHHLSQNPSSSNDLIRWSRYPEVFREPLRHAAWAMLNYALSDADLARHGAAMRARLSPGRLYRTTRDWLTFARWLTERGITELGQVSAEDLAEFSLHLARRGLSRNTVVNYLVGLSRLHSYARLYLPESDRLVEPPWLGRGIDDYLPAASARGENVTEPITPDTLGPLLVWALRMVEDCAGDIIAAHDERTRLLARAKNAIAEPLVTLLHRLRAGNEPIPCHQTNDAYAGTIAWNYLAGLTGASAKQAKIALRGSDLPAYAAAHPGPCPLDLPIRGTVGGQPWHPGITFDEAFGLVVRLVDCCFIVIAYLTGMRPGEVLGLRHGCCPTPAAEGSSAVTHLIHGRQFKHARDEHGNHDSAGAVRETPWIAIPPVVRAIRVLERLVGPGKLLFDAHTFDPRRGETRHGKAMATTTMANRLERTVAWLNALAEQLGRPQETIPPDGRIGIARFRRTLAWHIARRPGGLVALALQYGHLRTVISEGYASRSRGGIHDLLDIETARATADHLSDVHDALEAGHGVSGPAARRLINSATQHHHRFGGTVTTARQARTLLEDPTFTVFDNPDAYLTCNYNPAKALCHPDRSGTRDTPSLDRCVASCANIARTDTHAHGLTQAATDLRDQARTALLPAPLADRLHAKAEHLDQLAQQHHHQ
ncbi:integrase [Amycolatopsis sp. NPDC051102]|uniref:integrase n=1 Tax=Amycolatopsis sp. NPDC051102 TaxID=3155163 RepID=UPI00343B3E2E